MTARTLASDSPHGDWRAEALLASFPGEVAYEYARVTVSRVDGAAPWVPYARLNESGGLGAGYISDFAWSADGRYLYFKHTAASDGCGYPFTTELHQVDLKQETLAEIPLTGMLFGEVMISPDAARMAYRVEDGIFIYDLAEGTSRTVSYIWPEGFGFLVGWNAWSPDGEELAFTITQPLCDSLEAASSTFHVINLKPGETRTPGREDRWVYLPAPIVVDPIPTAALALQEYLSSLYWGGRGGVGDYTYARAVALYGGSYESLIEVNTDLDPSDHVALIQSACERNGYQCLLLRDVISSYALRTESGAQAVTLTVYLEDSEGGVFARGPCCGEEIGLPEVRFEFSVVQSEDGAYRVVDLPPYVP